MHLLISKKSPSPPSCARNNNRALLLPTRHQLLATRYFFVSSHVFTHFIALDSRLWTLDSTLGRRSPCPGRRRFEEVLPVAEEVALVWGLRYRWGVASWEEARIAEDG